MWFRGRARHRNQSQLLLVVNVQSPPGTPSLPQVTPAHLQGLTITIRWRLHHLPPSSFPPSKLRAEWCVMGPLLTPSINTGRGKGAERILWSGNGAVLPALPTLAGMYPIIITRAFEKPCKASGSRLESDPFARQLREGPACEGPGQKKHSALNEFKMGLHVKIKTYKRINILHRTWNTSHGISRKYSICGS